ncbi:MAG: AMP-binding protein [Proteobacteria bacterium]|nr:AMP-binding protein [Pseudomonadota bacterium]
MWEALEEAARELPDRRAYVYQGRDITFREVNERADRIAAGLLKLGFEKGDRIGIIGLNQPEWLYTYFGAAKIGAIVVGLSVRYRDVELDYIINHSQTRAVVTLPALGDMDYVQFFRDFRDKIPSVTEYVFIGGNGFEGGLSFESLLQTEPDPAALAAAKARVEPDDPIMIIYTSGTTGQPKGAALSHKSQAASARAEAWHLKLNEDDLVPIALPFNHVSGITCGIAAALLAKTAVVLVPFFDVEAMIDIYKKYQPTIYPGVPTMHVLLMLSPGFATWTTRDRIRVVLTGGSNSEPQLLTQLLDAFPQAAVMNFYGLSETSGGVIMSPWDSDFDHTVRCIGKTVGDFEAKVVSLEDGSDLPAGQTGELCIKGDAVVPGYFRMETETREAFRDGWLHTGDLAYMDPDGYVTLMGRLKEMYLQGGFNVYPAEVENLLTKHPKVLMAAGIGVPDPVLGEVGRYYIVSRPGTDPTAAELTAWCREKLADYKVPRQFVFRDQLPMTPVGKIMKAKLKEDYLAGAD